MFNVNVVLLYIFTFRSLGSRVLAHLSVRSPISVIQMGRRRASYDDIEFQSLIWWQGGQVAQFVGRVPSATIINVPLPVSLVTVWPSACLIQTHVVAFVSQTIKW